MNDERDDLLTRLMTSAYLITLHKSSVIKCVAFDEAINTVTSKTKQQLSRLTFDAKWTKNSIPTHKSLLQLYAAASNHNELAKKIPVAVRWQRKRHNNSRWPINTESYSTKKEEESLTKKVASGEMKFRFAAPFDCVKNWMKRRRIGKELMGNNNDLSRQN